MRRIGVVLGGVMLVWLAACASTPQRKQTAPGALPAQHNDVTPQINASTYVAHGLLLERQGKYDQAAIQYRRALELTPDLLVARNRLGITLNRLGQHAEASQQFRTVLTRDPKLAYAHNNLGFSLYREGKYADAEHELARALELHAAFPRARMNHALALGKLGRFDEARAEFGLVCGEADAYFNVSLIQAESGRYAEAARSLERALQLQPDLEAARQQLHEISRLAAEQEEAQRTAAEAAAAAEHRPPSVSPNASDVSVVTASDVRPAANAGAVSTGTPGQPPTAVQTPAGVDQARIAEQIRSLLGAVEGPMPPDEAVPSTVSNDALIALLDRMASASFRSAPWYDSYLQSLRDALKRGGRPQPTPPNGNLQVPATSIE